MIKFTRFSARALCIISCTAVAALAQPASARERPGGPSDAKARDCTLDPLNKQPAICFEFSNRASEPVRFMTEVTIDGQPVPVSAIRNQTECFRKDIYDCTASSSIWTGPLAGPGTPEGKTGDTIYGDAGFFRAEDGSSIAGWTSGQVKGTVKPQGFRITNVAPNSTYCVRFMAVRVSDHVWSEAWSEWACVKARPLPPKPEAPKRANVQCFPSYWDGTSTTKPLPYRAVVSWSGVSNAANYIITINGHDYTVPNTKDQETIEIPKEMVANCTSAVICAENISGQNCVRTLEGVPPPDVSTLGNPKHIVPRDDSLPATASKQGRLIPQGDPIPSVGSISRQGGILGSNFPQPASSGGATAGRDSNTGGFDGNQGGGTSVPGAGSARPSVPSGSAISCRPGAVLVNGQCNSGGSDRNSGGPDRIQLGPANGGGISPSKGNSTPAKTALGGAATSTTAAGDANKRKRDWFRHRRTPATADVSKHTRNSRFFRSRITPAKPSGVTVK